MTYYTCKKCTSLIIYSYLRLEMYFIKHISTEKNLYYYK